MNTGPTDRPIPAGTFVGNVEILEQDLLLPALKNKQMKTSENEWEARRCLETGRHCLSDDEMAQLRDLVDEFSDTTGEGVADLERTTTMEHVIEMVPGAAPLGSRPYSIPVNLRAEVKSQIDKMLEPGLIAKWVNEAWSLPIVLVKKKDETWRLWVDDRKLNAVIVRHSMALSNIENTMEIMYGRKFFSSIDRSSGFYQVALHKDSQEKRSFSTPWGLLGLDGDAHGGPQGVPVLLFGWRWQLQPIVPVKTAIVFTLTSGC